MKISVAHGKIPKFNKHLFILVGSYALEKNSKFINAGPTFIPKSRVVDVLHQK
jgi:hypothetical protein